MQQMVAELKFLRAANAGLVAERDALKGSVSVYERLITVERERGDFYKVAAEKGLSANNSSLQIDMVRAQEIRECTAENARIRIDNEKLRSSRNTRAIFAGFAGAIGGYALGSR